MLANVVAQHRNLAQNQNLVQNQKGWEMHLPYVLVAQNQKDWDLHLPYVLAAYRASESESTGFTPNRLFLSRELCLPIDLVLGDVSVANLLSTTDDFVAMQIENMQNNFETARKFMQRQATNRAFRYDLRVKPASFPVGSMVWYFYPRRRPGLKDKWAKLYTGPYEVVEQVNSVLYKIRKSARSRPMMVYVDKLKLVEGMVPQDQEERPPPEDFEPGLDLFSEEPRSEVGEGEGDGPSTPVTESHEPHRETFSDGRPKRLVRKPLRYR